VAPEASAAPVQPGERVNILAMALDQEALRTDVLLLVSLDPEQKRAGAIQLPRDTRAYLAGRGTIEKVNHAYVYGVLDEDESFPPNLRTLKTVEGLLGVRIHYTVVVDMAAFVRAVDAIGGVEVDIPFKMEYDDPYQDLHIHFEPGPQVLYGQQALEYVRWRHNNDGTGYPDEDLGRMRAQQAFMRTVIAKVTSPGSLVRLPALLDHRAFPPPLPDRTGRQPRPGFRREEQGFRAGRIDPPSDLPAAVRVVPGDDADGSLMVARSLLAQGYAAEMVTAGAEQGGAVRVILPAWEEPADTGRIR